MTQILQRFRTRIPLPKKKDGGKFLNCLKKFLIQKYIQKHILQACPCISRTIRNFFTVNLIFFIQLIFIRPFQYNCWFNDEKFEGEGIT
uniref:Uncharacterized protein n=1 Tax=Rhizophagus irregularis (strain DAOM 181602 / DAOM 197198 / MUCL 43194) TaxID=747089 RepID=U9TYE2_RHIID